MGSAVISVKIPFEGDKHRMILEALKQRIRACEQSHSLRRKKWKEAEDQMVGYMPETVHDQLRRGQRETGKPRYTTIMLPYSYAVVMAAHSYWSTVFLSRSPVLQFMGTTGEGEDQVMALEALANYQMIRGRILPNLYIWLQDVGKYGEAWISPYWKTVTTRTSEIMMEEEMYMGLLPTGRMKKVRRVTEITGYQGNAVYNVAPMNVYTDPRYPRNRFQEGEFVAVAIELSTNELLEGEKIGRYFNTEKVKQDRYGQQDRAENAVTDAESIGMERPDTTIFGSDVSKEAGDVNKCYEFVINLIPSKWGLGTGDMPEKWVMTVTRDFRILVEARPQGCLHDKFPLALMEVEPEGYGLFSRGLVEVFGPIQNTLDWLVNTHFFNVRQTLNNQFIYDPSRIETRDLENGKPGLAARLKPAAYGTDVRTAIYQLPVMDITRQHMSDIGFMYDLGERLGVNDKVMGQTNPSSRQSATESRGEATFSVSRLKTMSEYFSCTGWTDFSDIMISNSQQYYDGNMKLRIVGELAQYAGQPFIDVTPDMITGQFNFIPVDGTLPVDRYAQANLWREMITQMAQVPQVLMQYDLGKIFGYVAQLSGLRNIDRFKIQVVPDGMMQAQAAMGNAVPMGGGNPLEPGQVPLVGPTA